METDKKTVQIPSQGIIDRIKALEKTTADVSTFRGLSPEVIANTVISGGVVSLNVSHANEEELANFRAANVILREKGAPEIVLTGTDEAQKANINGICGDITGEIARHGPVRFRKFVESVLDETPEAFVEEFTRFTVPNNKGKKGARDLSYNSNLGLGDLSDQDISRRMDEVEEKLIDPVVARLRQGFRDRVLGQLPENDVLETEDEQIRGLVKAMVSNAVRGELYEYNDAKKVYGLRKKAVEVFYNETEEE